MKLICLDCGTQYDSGKFCPECGTKLQEIVPELVCPSCGTKAKSGKFCAGCGTKLVEQVDAVPSSITIENKDKRKFNERDHRFAKYYDRNGFPRDIPQEERDLAIEEFKAYADQGSSEAKMLLGKILIQEDPNTAIKLIKEAEEAGDKLAYYLMGAAYMYSTDDALVIQNYSEAEKRLIEMYQEYQNGDVAQILAELYACSNEKCDYKKAFEFATIAAEDDKTSGYEVLGALYLNGWGVDQNIQLALENYKMAAADGDEISMNQIGFIYMNGDGIEENPEQAFYWFNEAAQKNSDVGMYNLGYCYKNGYGVEQDAEVGAEWFKKAAEAGYIDSMIELGEYYQDTLFDIEKSKAWFLKAAENGSADAMNQLGVLYTDIDPDYQEAVKWFLKAIEQDNPWAYRNLAICYRDGSGVKQDLKKAEELFAKASELGIEDALEIKDHMLSSLDNEQVDKANSLLDAGKHKEAIKIYKKLAEEGNARAQGNYGKCLLYALGTKQNLKEGIIWLEKSAEQENAWSCLRLAEAYIGWDYNGKSIKADTRKVLEYLKKASKYGADSEEVNNLAQMTIPSVEISNVKVDRNVKNNGNLGLTVMFKMVANAMLGRKLNISAYCVSTNGDKLSLTSPGLRVMNPPNCYYTETCKPDFQSTVWEEFKLFIPYSMILNIQAKYKETLVIMAWDQTNKKPELLACEEIPFTISCVTHTFRSNEWDVTLHGQDPSKRIIKFHKKVITIDSTDNYSASKRIESCCKLPMDEIKKAAEAKYPKKSLKSLAIAALKIAEVIQERLPEADVSYMVHPSEFNYSLDSDALPIHFLFRKNGIPKVAVVAVTKNGYRTPAVVETQMTCKINGIEYIRVYANGVYADWIQGWSEFTPYNSYNHGPVSEDQIEFCKNWLVEKISSHL